MIQIFTHYFQSLMENLEVLYSGILDIRTISVNALPMTSMFDEFLIETPITNPNNVRPEFSPIENPSRYKYQALKDFLFMLQLEPYIGLGLVNLIPDPSEFDMPSDESCHGDGW